MNAINGQSSVNMLVNNSTVASGVAYGTASGYASAASGSQQVQIQIGGNQTLLNQTLNISGGNNNTILATGSGLTVFTDNKSTPPSGDVQIRAINASNSIQPSADVYIVPAGTDLSTVNPTATLTFQAASQYVSVAAGSYQIEFAQTGSKLPIINSGALSLSAGQIRTVVSLDGNGFATAVLSDLD
jgi:hypothetical protein